MSKVVETERDRQCMVIKVDIKEREREREREKRREGGGIGGSKMRAIGIGTEWDRQYMVRKHRRELNESKLWDGGKDRVSNQRAREERENTDMYKTNI